MVEIAIHGCQVFLADFCSNNAFFSVFKMPEWSKALDSGSLAKLGSKSSLPASLVRVKVSFSIMGSLFSG